MALQLLCNHCALLYGYASYHPDGLAKGLSQNSALDTRIMIRLELLKAKAWSSALTVA